MSEGPIALVKNAADRNQVKQAQQREQMEAQMWENVLRFMMASKEGKLFLATLFQHCLFWDTTYHPSQLGVYNNAQREVCVWVLAEINKFDRRARSKIATAYDDFIDERDRVRQAMHTKQQGTRQTGDDDAA